MPRKSRGSLSEPGQTKSSREEEAAAAAPAAIGEETRLRQP